jgi:electron transfer flavoprotein alpha subunit
MTGAGPFEGAGLGAASPTVAVLVVRDGQVPLGGDEAVAEAGGAAVLAGSGTEAAAKELLAAHHVRCAELGDFAPGGWAVALAPLLAPAAVVVLPASPDGRDLAPRLAHVLDRPLLAGATEVGHDRAVLVRRGGLVSEVHRIDGPVVATLVPGVRGVEPTRGESVVDIVAVEASVIDHRTGVAGERTDARASGAGAEAARSGPDSRSGPDVSAPGARTGEAGDPSGTRSRGASVAQPQPPGAGGESVRSRMDVSAPGATARDATVIEVVPPDPGTVDLADARRIVAGGAGLGGPEPFVLLERVAVALGAAFGATRVASDVGWAPHDRYIGTTGVAVDPDLYVALGISGAVQHVTGLGQPRHVIAVNTDASAPMRARPDLAIVADARALLAELAARLGVADAGPGGPEVAGADIAHEGSEPVDAGTTDRSGAADGGT